MEKRECGRRCSRWEVTPDLGQRNGRSEKVGGTGKGEGLEAGSAG